MSARWQSPLVLSALCVALAGGPSANLARPSAITVEGLIGDPHRGCSRSN